MQAKTLKDEYVVADPKGNSQVWKSEDFWKMAFDNGHPKNKPDMGYLISQFNFEEDWDSWENHPEGDEIVFCMTGKIKFIQEINGIMNESILLPGQYIVVPKDTWHTAKVKDPTSALFITWGFGTKHKKVES